MNLLTPTMTQQQPHQHQPGDLTVYRSSSNQSDFAFCFGGRSGSVEHLQERFLLDFQEPPGPMGIGDFYRKVTLIFKDQVDIHNLHGQDRWDLQKHLLKSYFVRYDLMYDLISMRVEYSQFSCESWPSNYHFRTKPYSSKRTILKEATSNTQRLPTSWAPVLKNSIRNFTMRNPWGIFSDFLA